MKPVMKFQALALLIAVGSLLTTSVMVSKAAPQFGWQPLSVLAWAMLGGAGIQFLLGGLWRTDSGWRRDILRFGVISGLLFAVPYATAAQSVAHVGAGFVAMSFALPLMITYAIALAIGLERFDPLRASGVMLGVIGAVILSSAKAGGDGGIGSLFWVIVVLLGQIVIAVGNIYRTRYWPHGAGPLQLSAAMMFFGATGLVIYNFAVGTPMAPVSWSAEATVLLIGQTIVFAVLFKLYFMLQQLAGPVYLSQIGMVSAVVGVGAAYLLFAEVPAVEFAVAAPFILGGIYFVNKRAAKVVAAE